ncbi:MAG: hypothetical protein U1C74_12360 [Phenylobacterium sp.]|nr:hypothetical protein [Phenylobacterium sp.]
MAIDDAIQYKKTYLTTPRYGQNRLWSTDVDLAFEVFEQGLRQGGRPSEGLAAPAVRTNPQRAVPILLRHVILEGNEKAGVDIRRAIRLAPTTLAEDRTLALLRSEDEEPRLRGVMAAGWVASPRLSTALLEVQRTDARYAIRRAVRDAMIRLDRLVAMASLAVDAGSASGEARWRRLALLADLDQDRVLRAYDDPLRQTIGDLDDRDLAILTARLKG